MTENEIAVIKFADCAAKTCHHTKDPFVYALSMTIASCLLKRADYLHKKVNVAYPDAN